MFGVVFYKDRKGNEPVLEYMRSLNKRNDKDSRIKLNKIRDYVIVLQRHGTKAGEPYVKHIDGEIWELRPLRDRILFAAWSKGQFVLLHCFLKKSRKTPKREIVHAKRNLQDLMERSQGDEY